MYHLQAKPKTGNIWTTYLTSEDQLWGRAKLLYARDRYQKIVATGNLIWRVVDAEELAAERLPLLQREASGPLTFLVLCMFVGLLGVLAILAWA
jgi:hypothetical protein